MRKHSCLLLPISYKKIFYLLNSISYLQHSISCLWTLRACTHTSEYTSLLSERLYLKYTTLNHISSKSALVYYQAEEEIEPGRLITNHNIHTCRELKKSENRVGRECAKAREGFTFTSYCAHARALSLSLSLSPLPLSLSLSQSVALFLRFFFRIPSRRKAKPTGQIVFFIQGTR